MNMVERVLAEMQTVKINGQRMRFGEEYGVMLVRAAIAAMREPTDAMVDAGYETIMCPTCGYSTLKEQAAINWQAMVDKALEE